MSTGFKKKEFKITPKVIFRVLIFSVIVFFSITYLSGNKQQLSQIEETKILGEETKLPPANPPQTKVIFDNLYNQIPADSRQKLETLNKSPVIILIQEKLDIIKSETNNFPQKQIKDIKKTVIQNMYQNLMNSVESGK